ncbi:MAG: hypothetical protein IV090_03350 [Candidatus Sericytochromatia bacterium]|nr:hypothetical protein [Candidatus Sericytochromatia bacterium]
MKRFFQSFSSLIAVFLVLCVGLNACTPPGKMVATRPESEKGAFKTLQANNEQEPPEPDPLAALPTGDDPDQVVILEADSTIPIKVTVEQPYPKNSKLELQNIQFQPAIIQPVFVKGNTPEELRALEKGHLQATKAWYRDIYRVIRRSLVDYQRQTLKDAREKFEHELAFADGKADRKVLRAQFEAEQKERRSTFREQRKELKKTRKEDIALIQENVRQQFQKSESGFSISAVPFAVPVFIVVGIFALACNFVFNCKEIFLNSNKPAPTPPPHTADYYTYPANATGTNMLPGDVSTDIQTSEIPALEVIPSDEMYQKAKKYLQDNQLSSAGLAVRSKDILEELQFSLDPADLNRYAHCNTRTELGQLPPNCDVALEGLLNGLNQNNLPGTLTTQTFRDQGTSSYIFSVRFNAPAAGQTESDRSVKKWLAHLFATQYPASYDNPSNKAKLEQLNYSLMGLELKTPATCKDPKTLKYETQGIVSFQAAQPGSALMVDGDYTLQFYVGNPNQKTYLDKAKVTIEKLSEKLGIAAYQLHQKGLMPLTFGKLVPISHKILHVQVNNKTANHWNAAIEKVSSSTLPPSRLPCSPVYSVDCMNTPSGTFRIDTAFYESGLYRLTAQYSTSTYPNNAAILAENTSAKHTDDSTPLNPRFTDGESGYKFLVPNLVYSTFSRYTNYPESISLASQFNPNISTDILSHLLDFKQGFTGLNWPDEFDENTARPTQISRPFIAPDAQSDLPGSKIISESLKTFNATPNSHIFQATNESPWQTALKERLFVDLAKSQNNAPFAAFRNTQITPDETPRFLNVGAVINLSNRVFRLNKALAGRNPSEIPLILEVRTQQNIAIAKWRFNARIGAYTVFQEYWDGQPRTLEDDENEKEVQSPTYTQGNYQIVVSLDNEAYNSEAWFNLKRLQHDGAFIMKPFISSASTQSTVAISKTSPVNTAQTCDNLKALATAIDARYTQLASINLSKPANWIDKSFSIAAETVPPADYQTALTNLKALETQLARVRDACKSCNQEQATALSLELKTATDNLQSQMGYEWMLTNFRSELLKTVAVSNLVISYLRTDSSSLREAAREAIAKVEAVNPQFINLGSLDSQLDLFVELALQHEHLLQFVEELLERPSTSWTATDVANLRLWANELSSLGNQMQSILNPDQSFRTQNIFAIGLAVTNPWIGVALLVTTFALPPILNHLASNQEKYLEAPNPLLLTNLGLQIQAAVSVINAYRSFSDTLTYGDIGLGDSDLTDDLVESEATTGPLWDNIRGGLKPEALPNWEPWDNAHHIIPQTATRERIKAARDTVAECNSNQGGIHSKSNGSVLHPWFHHLLHNDNAYANLRNYIVDELSKSKNNDKFGVCNLKNGDKCAKINEFIENYLDKYLNKLNEEHKKVIEELVKDYLQKNSKVSNVKKINAELAKSNSSLIRGNGPRVGKVEINRILYNKTKGSQRIGLEGPQRQKIEFAYKEKINNGSLKMPEYRNKRIRLEELCDLINKYLNR